MSSPNQKLVLIDRTPPNEQSGKIIIDSDSIMLAGSRLTHAGLMVYLYFLTQVPDTYSGIRNTKNKRRNLFEFSPQALENTYGFDHTSAQRGFKNLIEKGYLTPTKNKKNIYQFIDILPEDRLQTAEEYEEISIYEESLKDSINQLKAISEERKINAAKNYISQESMNKQEPNRKKYDWE